MFLFDSEKEQKGTKVVKDMFRNDVELDSKGNIILKKE